MQSTDFWLTGTHGDVTMGANNTVCISYHMCHFHSAQRPADFGFFHVPFYSWSQLLQWPGLCLAAYLPR